MGFWSRSPMQSLDKILVAGSDAEELWGSWLGGQM
jgi:hypothetical protein